MKKQLITDIQKYSIHDGKGIRTTVFFKGCPLSCKWCHNPETQQFTKQLLFQKERCTGCARCVIVCPNKAIKMMNGIAVTDENACNQCGVCIDYCVQNIRQISGDYYTVDELVREIEKDRVFYEQSGGGVTLSGGEVLAQDSEFLEELLVKLHRKGLRINIDTCGYAPFEKIKRLLPYIDTFLYDLKIMDRELHKQFTGVDNELILHNLKQLSSEHASIWLRVPVIGGVNASVLEMEQIARFLKDEKITVKQINILPYHNTGSSKYERLQLDYKEEAFTTPDNVLMDRFVTVFCEFGYHNVKIGG